MEVDAAKLIGAGLAVIGLGGVGAGIGNIFANTISSLARNPAAQPLIQLRCGLGSRSSKPSRCTLWSSPSSSCSCSDPDRRAGFVGALASSVRDHG